MKFGEKQIKRFGLAMFIYALASIGLAVFFQTITPQAQATMKTAQYSLALDDEAARSKLAAAAVARDELQTFLIWDSAALVPLYTAFLLVTSFVLSQSSFKWARTAAWLAAIAALTTAFADLTENFRFYELLETNFASGDSAANHLVAVGWAARVKWIALFIAMAISATLFRRGGWQWNLAALTLFAASLIGLFGLANYRPLIGYALAAQTLILLFIGAALTFSAAARRSFLQQQHQLSNDMAEKNSFPIWNKDNPHESLEAIYLWTVENAEQSIRYYSNKKITDRAFSKKLRFFSIFFVALGALCPLVDATQVVAKYIAPGILLGQWGYVLLAIAAAIVGFDFYFGHSSGWMRFVVTETAIERALKKFQGDWTVLQSQRTGDLNYSQMSQLLKTANDFTLQVEELIKQEVDSWVMEFQTNIAHLEKVLKAERKNKQ